MHEKAYRLGGIVRGSPRASGPRVLGAAHSHVRQWTLGPFYFVRGRPGDTGDGIAFLAYDGPPPLEILPRCQPTLLIGFRSRLNASLLSWADSFDSILYSELLIPCGDFSSPSKQHDPKRNERGLTMSACSLAVPGRAGAVGSAVFVPD